MPSLEVKKQKQQSVKVILYHSFKIRRAACPYLAPAAVPAATHIAASAALALPPRQSTRLVRHASSCHSAVSLPTCHPACFGDVGSSKPLGIPPCSRPGAAAAPPRLGPNNHPRGQSRALAVRGEEAVCFAERSITRLAPDLSRALVPIICFAALWEEQQRHATRQQAIAASTNSHFSLLDVYQLPHSASKKHSWQGQ